MRNVLTVLGLVSVSATASAADPVAAIEQFSAGLDRYEARFEQVLLTEFGEELDRSSGRVYLQLPDKYRWHYLDPFEQVIVADGEKVWVHDVDLEQVSVRDQFEVPNALALLLDPRALQETYELSVLAVDGNQSTIGMVAREPGGDFSGIEFVVGDLNLHKVTFEDALGQVTVIRFADAARNPPIDPLQFSFVIPEGADVIGMD